MKKIQFRDSTGLSVTDPTVVVVPTGSLTKANTVDLTDSGPGGFVEYAAAASATENVVQIPDASSNLKDGLITQAGTAGNSNAGYFVGTTNIAGGYATTATAAGTTTLTVASKGTQYFTGTTTQIVTLPVVTTLPQTGFAYLIVNNSTGAVTVNASGGAAVRVIPGNSFAIIRCILLTGTTAASWNAESVQDTNNNISANNLVGGYTATATAAGTTTLTVTSTGTQVFTGVTTQIVTLPVVTTLPQAGLTYRILNKSTGALTVNSSGSNLVQTIPAGATASFTNNKITADTTAAAWTVQSVVDTNGNFSGNVLSGAFTTTATAAGTTTLTVASTQNQEFTGVTTQTVVLPVVTTLPQAGFAYLIVNNSSGTVTVNSSGSNLVQTLLAGQRTILTATKITADTTAAAWDTSVLPNTAPTGVHTFVTPALGTPGSGVLTNCTVATASANDNDTSIASTAFVQGQGQGYLVYRATLTQTSTNAPVAQVGENNIGQTMTWAYVSPGIYTVTAGAAAFPANKTFILYAGVLNLVTGTSLDTMSAVRTSTTVITVQTARTTVALPAVADALLTEVAIEIIVFP